MKEWGIGKHCCRISLRLNIRTIIIHNVFINEYFLFLSNLHLRNFADGNTLYVFRYNLEEIKNMFWILVFYMTLNADKCHFMCLDKDTENGTFIFNKEKKLLITIDNKLTFKSRIKILCKKAPQKIGALSSLLNHLNYFQKRLIFSSKTKSQFNYCPFIVMFCSRTSNNMINKIHERALRLILNTIQVTSHVTFAFKTSWSRQLYLSWSYVFKTSSRRLQDGFKISSWCLQDVFKTPSRPLQGVLPRRLQNVFEISGKNVFKTSSRCFQDGLSS